LAYIEELSGLDDSEPAIGKLVWTVYQATRNSSETTKNAAREVARAIGARHFELDVDALVDGYQKLVEQALGEPLVWQKHDLALQNIQARGRAPSVWMLANVRGALLLSTSNRSEAAVGYATMDGDTAGGLSPIAGIDKAFLRKWLLWMQHDGPLGLGPLPALAAITAQAPTAELRPPDANQTDETDLMPYELLDVIERAAIRDKRTPIEVYRIVRARYPNYSKQDLLVWIERFFLLWSRNQWKRERYAPSFHVDDANLDPKTWCRFPILSGGFERELAELFAYVKAET
jgi:NAD+ synthase (glutamine-hydrolysing)